MRRLGISGARALPEDSIAMRVVVALAVEVGLVAVISQGVVSERIALVALALAPFGYLVSHRRRGRPNVGIKVALAAGLLLALARFLGQMGTVTSPDAARAPLAALFVWVQVLHAFDVPRRRDLAFSMVSSTTLIAVGGALALTSSYLGLLLAWALLAGAWLWLSARPLAGDLDTAVAVARTRDGSRGRLAPVRTAVSAATAALLLAVAIFSLLPRVPSTMVRALPFRMSPGAATAPPGDGVQNPALPPPTDGSVVDFSSNGYPGFSDVMDLRARGTLSDDIVFRVRASFASLWRAEVFDTYDGSTWTRSTSRLLPLVANDAGGYDMPSAVAPSTDGRTLVQTFFIEQQQPNVLFAAGEPRTVYFPSGGLRSDPDRSIRSPIFLDQGLVYSVESTIPTATPEQLRALGRIPRLPGSAPTQRMLQLPATLPQRVRDLAAAITAGTSTEYDAVQAVQRWLQTNTRYDLTVPREPDGVDAVDHFLFETRRGFCEHIAASMAVLLRSQGIPARIVTGYGPGERNPFTGYFEVRNSDAHAWVEVLYPGYGWVPYDPTFGVPPVPDAWGSPAGADLVAWVADQVGRVVPSGLRTRVGDAARGVIAVARAGIDAWPWLLVVALAGVGVWLLRRRRRSRPAPAPDAIAAAYTELLAALATVGHAPDPANTPAEIRRAVAADDRLDGEAADQAALVLVTVQRARFARPPDRPGDVDVMRALAAASRVRELMRHS
ncbi:MAG: transglutaminase domain-containing protein [Actinomycetota bacterium]